MPNPASQQSVSQTRSPCTNKPPFQRLIYPAFDQPDSHMICKHIGSPSVIEPVMTLASLPVSISSTFLAFNPPVKPYLATKAIHERLLCHDAGKPPFKRLIYPMPESWGLGVHLTLDLEGRARFGPDVEWIDKVEYNTSPELCDKFYPVIRQYWPGLPDGSLRPSYSGIRPKVCCGCVKLWLIHVSFGI